MGIASLILGIVVVVWHFFFFRFMPFWGMPFIDRLLYPIWDACGLGYPCVNGFELLSFIVCFILGICGLISAKKKNEPAGLAVAGIVLNILACAFFMGLGALSVKMILGD